MKLFPTSSQMLTSTSTHTVRLAFLFGLIATAILAQDCSNPLLNRTDVQARFGGSANILNTSRVAGNLSVCPFLSGQSVCVSDEGFSALQVFLDQYKQAFTQRSHQADQKRYKGIGNNMKGMSLNNAKTKAVYTLGMLFNYTILSFNATCATQPYNFTAFYTMAQQMGLTVAVNESQSAQQGGQNQGISNHNAQQGGKQGNAGENGQHGQQGNQTQPENQTQNGTEGNQTQQGPQPGQQQNHDQPGNNNSAPINGSNLAGNMSNQTNSTGPQNNQQQQQPGGSNRLRRLQDVSSNVSEDLNSSATTQQHWDNLQSNLMQAKAKCAISVMKQLYFSSCIAASANFTNATNTTTTTPNNTNSTNSSSSTNTSSILSGTADAPMFKISPDACSAFKSKCLDYFTYSAAAESTRAMIQNAQSSYSEQVYNIVTSTNDTTTINDELNTLATTILAEMNAAVASGNASTKMLSSLSCNSTNSNASDCNYICTNVLNATGFNEDSFSLVSSSSSSSSSNSSSTRRLSSSSSSGSITIDASGANPDTTISDSDSAVVVSVSSNPDSSFGFKKTVSVLFVVVSMFGGLFF